MQEKISLIINNVRYDDVENTDSAFICAGCALEELCDEYESISSVCNEILPFNHRFEISDKLFEE